MTQIVLEADSQNGKHLRATEVKVRFRQEAHPLAQRCAHDQAMHGGVHVLDDVSDVRGEEDRLAAHVEMLRPGQEHGIEADGIQAVTACR